MKIRELVSRRGGRRLSPLGGRVLQYLEAHPQEVFRYRDDALAQALGMKPSALSFTLWDLEKKGFIGKENLEGKVYFGGWKAIQELRRQTRRGSKGKPLARASVLRERIKARTGHIPVLDLLDTIRGPWE